MKDNSTLQEAVEQVIFFALKNKKYVTKKGGIEIPTNELAKYDFVITGDEGYFILPISEHPETAIEREGVLLTKTSSEATQAIDDAIKSFREKSTEFLPVAKREMTKDFFIDKIETALNTDWQSDNEMIETNKGKAVEEESDGKEIVDYLEAISDQVSSRYELFAHLSNEHGLTLLESELQEIEHIVLKNQSNQKIKELEEALRECERHFSNSDSLNNQRLQTIIELALNK